MRDNRSGLFAVRGCQKQNDGNFQQTSSRFWNTCRSACWLPPQDKARCDELILEHHYLHDATLVGEQLRYAATYKGRWLALATWSGASFHPEFRRAQALGYPLAGMVCLIVMALASGVRQGPDDLAQFADTLTNPQLRALGFRRDKRTGRHRCPRKTTFTRVLAQVNAPVLQRLLLD